MVILQLSIIAFSCLRRLSSFSFKTVSSFLAKDRRTAIQTSDEICEFCLEA